MLYLHDVWVNWFEGRRTGTMYATITNGAKRTLLSY